VGTLFLVATPIGNLEDITLRALRILGEASCIAAEDTRQTRKLLERYQIRVPLISYHEHNKRARLGDVLGRLARGDVARFHDVLGPTVPLSSGRQMKQLASVTECSTPEPWLPDKRTRH